MVPALINSIGLQEALPEWKPRRFVIFSKPDLPETTSRLDDHDFHDKAKVKN